MHIAFLLFFIVAGALACSDDHCKDPILAQELKAVKLLPNREQLKTICPKVIKFLECEKEYFECPGSSLDQLTASSDKLEAAQSSALVGAISVVRDVCDEDSSFHSDYIARVDCIRAYIEDAAEICADAQKPVEEFFNQLYSNIDEENVPDKVFYEIHCVSQAAEVACLVNNVKEYCGPIAQNIAVSILERMKSVLGIRGCKELENSADIKTQFLDFLEADEEQKIDMKRVFDLFKRRR